MSIGSFKAAVVSGIGEATAALVNFNLDFSLFEAPKEFSPVGDALSSIRRGSAESGVVHTTPRKLGTLFDPLLPDTPQLIKAYGSRASEIEIKSKIENRNTNYGVSESQVHLLACILARIWESGEATAIWDEIVSTQKQVILAKCNESGSVDMVSWVVAKQQIIRKELRDWDASARAWLSWLSILAAAHEHFYADNLDRRVYSRLLKLGRRRTGPIGKPDRPFFGLSEPKIFVQLPSDVEGRIHCLRTIAQTTAFEPADIVIRYRPDPSASFEYATALPRPKRSLNDMEDDVHSLSHTRWMRMASQRFVQRQLIENIERRYYYNPNKDGSQILPREKVQLLDCEIIRYFRLAGETAFQWDSAGSVGRSNNFKFWLGDENVAALFYAQDTISPPELAPFRFISAGSALQDGQSPAV
ncbi:hypothetical protein BDW60DRAFT_202674 [Aspergillus nidulans var. acristatus]